MWIMHADLWGWRRQATLTSTARPFHGISIVVETPHSSQECMRRACDWDRHIASSGNDRESKDAVSALSATARSARHSARYHVHHPTRTTCGSGARVGRPRTRRGGRMGDVDKM